MKYKILCLLLLASLSFHAQATPILSFDPTDQQVELGGSVSVDLRISDLGDDILTGFDIDVSFDDAILGFDSFAFGTGLDVFLLGANFTDVFEFGGTVNVFELSFDSDEDLMDFQPNDFVLGTFTFTALMLGTSSLDVTFSLLSGQFEFDPLLGFDVPKELFADVEGGSIEVVSVPEPGTLALLSIGLAGMGLARGKKKSLIQ